MDRITTAARSDNMRRIKGKDTKPELVVRRLLHRLGYRYRLHRSDIPGKPDVVFAGRRKVIFVHGCFWHQHSGCRGGRRPGSNEDYWGPKLARNVSRDERVRAELFRQGWSVSVVWACELKDEERLRDRLVCFLEEGRGFDRRKTDAD